MIALGNFKDTASVPKLIDILFHDPRPVLRGTAAWALARIGGEAAAEAVSRALESEQDEEVLERLQAADRKLRGERRLEKAARR